MAKEIGSNSNGVMAHEIRSFAVLDLETSNLPNCNYNKVAITELCIYGFAASELRKEKQQPESTVGGCLVPKSPRVLHKLTLLLKPCMTIDPIAARMTNLNNEMLEEESHFDENAANTLLGFLKHLQSPVCLVAHNGWNFDFPILKASFVNINKHLPADVYCVDSFRAFYEIDLERPIRTTPPAATSEQQSINSNETPNLTEVEATDNKDDDIVLRYAQNEVTPERPITNGNIAGCKRRHSAVEVLMTPENNAGPRTSAMCQSQRFRSNISRRKRFPPKGLYKLDNIYERIFQQAPAVSHHAEADVETLMKLVLHYGNDFLDYANLRARSCVEVNPIGFKSIF